MLEMGDQIKLVDRTRNLIRLSGFVPEELVGKNETIEPSGMENIFRVRPEWIPEPTFLEQKISELEQLAAQGKSKAVIEQLCEIMPTYCPTGVNGVKAETKAEGSF